MDLAAEYYEAEQEHLGVRFLNEIAATADRISDHPNSYPLAYRELRYAKIRRFPYCLVSEVGDSEVVIIECRHMRRQRSW